MPRERQPRRKREQRSLRAQSGKAPGNTQKTALLSRGPPVLASGLILAEMVVLRKENGCSFAEGDPFPSVRADPHRIPSVSRILGFRRDSWPGSGRDR